MAGVAYLLLSFVAGAGVCGLLRLPLRLEERVLLSGVIGLCGGAVLTLLVTLANGNIGAVAAFLGPMLLLCAGAVVSTWLGAPWEPWVESWQDARRRWTQRRLWRFGVVAALVVAFFVFVFHHALFTGPDGTLLAGWENVWSDWSNHATTASSFAYGNDVPVQSPLYAGTPQLYPFMPDFQAGLLIVLGWSLPAALSTMSAIMAVLAGLLVVCLAERLTGSYLAGLVTLSVCVFGAGLAFVGVMTDACSMALTGQPYPAQYKNNPPAVPDITVEASLKLLDERCTTGYLFHNTGDAVSLFVRSLGKLPAVLTNQPRAYDTDLDGGNQLDQVWWYTPLMAWWLPQRSFLYGFALALSVLLLLWVALTRSPRAPPAFVMAGALAGLLPLFHVHSLVALALVTPFAMWHWRQRWREWMYFVIAGAVVAVTRLAQLAAAPHGTTALGNNFPRFQIGWKAFTASDPAQPAVDPVQAVNHPLALFSHPFVLMPSWWSFWIWNTGILLPLFLLAVFGVALRWYERLPVAPTAAAAEESETAHTHPDWVPWGERITNLFGADVLRFTLPFLLVLLVGNVLVFQSWDWDNTKLFLYWHFAGALLLGALVARWWRRGWWRPPLAALLLFVTVALGVVSTARLVPDSAALTVAPGSGGVAGFGFASVEDQQLARTLRDETAPHSVFLTSEAVSDPALTLAGRSTLLGFLGWLGSYGIDYTQRSTDVSTMYKGCPTIPDQACTALQLLRQYHVDYAEIWDDAGVGGLPPPGQQWWHDHFPVVASNSHITVYDVRGA